MRSMRSGILACIQASILLLALGQPAHAQDVARETWSIVDSMRQPRWGASVETVDGKIFVIGGNTSSDLSNPMVTDSVHMYNPNTGAWQAKKCMPHPLYLSASTVHDGLIIVLGGQDQNGAFSDIIQAYDPDTNQWFVSFTRIPIVMAGAEAVTVADSIFLIGGRNTYWINAVYVIDPIQWEIHAGPPMPHARAFSGGTRVGDSLVTVVGGRWIDDLPFVDNLNIPSGIWTDTTDLVEPRSYLEAVSYGDRIFITGGQFGETISNGFSMLTDSEWAALDPMIHARSSHGCARVDSTLYVLGGYRKENTEWIIEPSMEACVLPYVVLEEGIGEPNEPSLEFRNPLTLRDVVRVTAPKPLQISVYDVSGRMLRRFRAGDDFTLGDVLPVLKDREGILFLRVRTNEEEWCYRLLLLR
jgi:hypothetical protein